MQTITTKYHPVTTHRAAWYGAQTASGLKHRIAASLGESNKAHQTVAALLLKKVGWTGKWVAGGNKDGSYTWVCVVDNPVLGSPEPILM